MNDDQVNNDLDTPIYSQREILNVLTTLLETADLNEKGCNSIAQAHSKALPNTYFHRYGKDLLAAKSYKATYFYEAAVMVERTLAVNHEEAVEKRKQTGDVQ